MLHEPPSISSARASLPTRCSGSEPRSSPRVFNLTFHGLGTPGPAVEQTEQRYWLRADVFEHWLDLAAEWPDARITFDDGNLSDVTLALPRLVQRGWRASFFVVAARVGKQSYLGLAELRELLAAGMEIGSHGMHHQSWRRLHGQGVQQEIFEAKARLEDWLGIPITQAASPFGTYDRTSLRALAQAGFSRVYSSDRGWARPDAWLQSRNTLTVATEIRDLEQVRAWSSSRQLTHRLKLALKRWR